MWLWDYAVAVLWGWWGLAAALLGMNEISEKLLGISWRWLRDLRWRVVVVLLMVAPAFVYKDLTAQVDSLKKATQQQQSPVVAEAPTTPVWSREWRRQTRRHALLRASWLRKQPPGSMLSSRCVTLPRSWP